MAIQTERTFCPHKHKATNPQNPHPSVLHLEILRKSPKTKPKLIKIPPINKTFSHPFWACSDKEKSNYALKKHQKKTIIRINSKNVPITPSNQTKVTQ